MRIHALIVPVRAFSRVCCALVIPALLSGCPCELGHSSGLRVFAASSLTEVFQELEGAFEAANQDAEISLRFGESQGLRSQIEEGARADVFASADASHVDALARAGRIHESQVFAQGELALVVPLENPAKIESFADLPRAKRVVVGGPTVPVGKHSRVLLERAAQSFGPEFRDQVLAHVVSEESNVRLVRAKVELGEADAAIIYRTDVTPSSRLRIIPIPAVLNVTADYSMGIVDPSRRVDLARRWIAFVRSEEGRRILTKHGFVAK